MKGKIYVHPTTVVKVIHEWELKGLFSLEEISLVQSLIKKHR